MTSLTLPVKWLFMNGPGRGFCVKAPVKGLLIFNIQRHIYNGYTIIGRLLGLGIYGATLPRGA